MTEEPQGESQIVTIINTSGVPDTLRKKAVNWLLRLVGGTVCSGVVG